MRTTRTAAAIAALLLAAGLLVACGGDSKADYAEEVEDILNPLGQELSELGTTVGGATSAEALAEAVGEVEQDLDDAASDIEGLDVPDGVEEVNADLVAAIQGFADDLGNVRAAAESGDQTALQEATAQLPAAASGLQEELGRIQQAAIDAGVPIEEPSE